ncbi:MAG: helix-turn-helix transcriptional regulator [Sphingomonadales bacterium]|nr:helix-turn-helix transcriptional regulator [Sphingomonadales bacterium]MBD3773560.1 helix-turn-helix transcriptional regulator [Paracoccaceae bacterium]
MVIKAQLTEGEARQRGEARRSLHFETQGVPQGAAAVPVQLHNASTTGLLIETEAALEVGGVIDIDLPHAGLTPARVVWASGRLYGCQFDQAISAAALSATRLRSDAEFALPQGLGAQPDESFGARLQRLRKERGMTLEQLGDRLGVSKPTVWAWEQGKAKPLGSRLSAIAGTLDVPLETLAGNGPDSEAIELVARSRERIAQAFGTVPDKVRIMIEL